MLQEILNKIIGLNSRQANLYYKDKQQTNVTSLPLSSKLNENLRTLQEKFQNCSDLVFRSFTISPTNPVKAYAIYIEGLCDAKTSGEQILKAVMNPKSLPASALNIADYLIDHLISITNANKTNDLNKLTDAILEGNLVLLINGCPDAVIASAQGWEHRAIDDPPTESVINGPKDGLVEDLRLNSAMIRRRLKTTDLQIEGFQVGSKTKTKVEIYYLRNTASDKVVEEVRRRISQIDIDGILSGGYLEELISDEGLLLFPLTLTTERPDKIAAAILEGKIGIIVDTSPMALIVPITFVSLLQASEDYYMNYIYASAVRLLRFLALNISLLLPSLYISIMEYHQEFLPPHLIQALMSARSGVPFPVFVEALNLRN